MRGLILVLFMMIPSVSEAGWPACPSASIVTVSDKSIQSTGKHLAFGLAAKYLDRDSLAWILNRGLPEGKRILFNGEKDLPDVVWYLNGRKTDIDDWKLWVRFFLIKFHVDKKSNIYYYYRVNYKQFHILRETTMRMGCVYLKTTVTGNIDRRFKSAVTEITAQELSSGKTRITTKMTVNLNFRLRLVAQIVSRRAPAMIKDMLCDIEKSAKELGRYDTLMLDKMGGVLPRIFSK